MFFGMIQLLRLAQRGDQREIGPRPASLDSHYCVHAAIRLESDDESCFPFAFFTLCLLLLSNLQGMGSGSGLRKEERERNTIFVPKPTLTCRLLLGLAAVHLIWGYFLSPGLCVQ